MGGPTGSREIHRQSQGGFDQRTPSKSLRTGLGNAKNDKRRQGHNVRNTKFGFCSCLLLFLLCVAADLSGNSPDVEIGEFNPGSSNMNVPTKSRSLRNLNEKGREGVSFPAWLPNWYNHGDGCIKTNSLETPIRNKGAGFNGQGGEDEYAVKNFFTGVQHGTYLEMGAFNGVKFSNTLHLHEALGWHGLLIEANPLSYLELVKNRPDDICINAAVCAQPSTVHFVEAGGATAGIYEFMPATFLKSWYNGIDVNTLPTVRCLPLMDVLAKMGIDHIDFWSLDVEGGELEVLRTVDFEKVEIGVLVVEADGHNQDKNTEVRKLLLSRGFKYHGAVGNNDWFVGPKFVPSSSKAMPIEGKKMARNPRQGGISQKVVNV